jgi:hypothetical protein
MTSIKTARTSIDSKLDKWEAQATALQSQFELSKEQVTQRVDDQKHRLQKIASNVKENINANSRLPEEIKGKIKSSFEHLQVQLSLGKIDSREAYQEWKDKVKTSIAKFEDNIELTTSEAEAEGDKLVSAFVKEADILEAEIEAQHMKFNDGKARGKAGYEEYKQDVQEKIAAYKSKLDEQRKLTKNKLGSIEGELSTGMTKVKKAFNDLFS